jgi:hypothetical protein
MNRLFLLLGLFFPLNAALAQSVTVGDISKTTLCSGDTVWVPYLASGSFQADNFFALQISDASGSFATFTNIGHGVAESDSIPVVLWNTGDHFVIRVIATDPYTISSNTSPDIQVFGYPSPNPLVNLRQTFFGPTAFIGDTVQFSDQSGELPGSKYEWSFGQDADIFVSINPSPKASYSSVGLKSGSLSVTNSTGCSTSKPFQLEILTCTPLIPDSAHIVTGNESGTYSYVWVKAGGNYYASNEFTYATVFVEPGGSMASSFRSEGLYYIKTGASFTAGNSQGSAVVILNSGNTVSFDSRNDAVDTLYCNDLQFDYSQIALKILNIANGLQIRNEGEEISASVVNPLGVILFSKTERDMLAIDYSALTSGVYFVIITSGNHRELRKIAVVH